MSNLKGKYAKLRDDLKKAIAAGILAENNHIMEMRMLGRMEDGGTCNFDAASIKLPRWNTSMVKQAAKEAGTVCFDWTLFGSKRFVFEPKTRCQGTPRSLNAEAMTKVLRDAGYDAMDYSAMD